MLSHARIALQNPESALFLTFGGWFGVELFFALSGFLIGTILIKANERGLSGNELGRFWFRRWMRTLPAYFAILLFVWALFGKIQVSDFVLLQWIIDRNLGSVPVSWSLAVEEWFYITLPLILICLAGVTKKYAVPIAVGLLILLPFLVRIYQVEAGIQSISIRANPFRFDGMAYGVLAAYLISTELTRRHIEKHRRSVAAIAALLFLLEFARYNAGRMELPVSPTLLNWYSNTLAYTVTGICAALITLSAYLASGVEIPLPFIVRYVSQISYSLYLWHLLIFSFLAKEFIEYRGVGLYIFVIISAILISAIPYYVIEIPFMKLRDRLTAR